MKSLLFGDLHGRDPFDLERVIRKENFENVICTGDFDTVFSINRYLEMIDAFPKSKFYTCAGNHDEGIYNNHILTDSNFTRFGMTLKQMHEELKSDDAAYAFIGDLLNKKQAFMHLYESGREPLRFLYFRTVVMHGSYGGRFSQNWFENFIAGMMFRNINKDIWRYLQERDSENNYQSSVKSHRDNFMIMKTHGCQVMLKGHDHYPEIAFQWPNGDIQVNNGEEHPTMLLQKGFMYTITPGAFKHGHYAVIETDGNAGIVNLKRL
ncbi:MAG: metallophosphoesterase [Candidatus Woesearchaeota archaeon]|nr:metallophosphoesterase [Candidatus Woesearchaeota archaeon]